jgi:S-adenosylmethionine hydrolase
VTRPIFLLTDFGLRDHYAGQVRAVIASIAPGAAVHDITHEVEPFAIDAGAWLLETSLPVLPGDAVVMAVIDPGVGTVRQPLALTAGGRSFVGPDNGLLSPAFPAAARAGLEALSEVRLVPGAGGADARVLEDPRFRREAVSHTFHGRDIFAPAAAYLASGADPADLGPPADTAWLLPPFRARPTGDGLRGYVVHIDRFGNLITTIHAEQLPAGFTLEIGGQRVERRLRTFGEAKGQEIFCHVDSSGFLAIAANGRSAAADLGVGRGDAVELRPA